MHRLMLVLAVLGVSSVANGEVIVGYSPTTISQGETTTVAVTLSSNPGLDLTVTAVLFDFVDNDDYVDLNVSDFSWTPDIMNDQNEWFVTTLLPSPQAVAFSVGAAIGVVDGAIVEVATFNVTPDFSGGELTLITNPRVTGEDFGFLDIKGGVSVTFVPEPSGCVLLVMGVAMTMRRRRVRDRV
jgi:hypothetical protein